MLSGHVDYEIITFDESESTLLVDSVSLRYSQIEVFLEMLKRSFPGCVVPKLRNYSLVANVVLNNELTQKRREEIIQVL